MGKKMNNAPVYFVLAHVQFNALLTLESYVPAIQDALRKSGYADFAKAVMATINFNAGVPASANQMPVGQVARYYFLNDTKSAGFILDQTSLMFQTTEYDTYEAFRDALLFGLKTVNDSVGGLSFSERIGIRYLDAICPRANDKVSDYLSPTLIGMFDKLNDRKLAHTISESWSTLDKTTLMCRAIIQDQAAIGVSFAPDLQPVILQTSEKFRKISGLYGILDTDCWYQNRQKFDLESVKEILASLHATVRKSFGDMVTPHALQVWE